MIPAETIPGIPEGGEEKDGRGEFKYDFFWYIIRTFVNATMVPHHKNKEIHKKRVGYRII
jgi:hypothetical protein